MRSEAIGGWMLTAVVWVGGCAAPEEVNDAVFRQGTSSTTGSTSSTAAGTLGFDDDGGTGHGEGEEPCDCEDDGETGCADGSPAPDSFEEVRDGGRAPFQPGCIEVSDGPDCRSPYRFFPDSCIFGTDMIMEWELPPLVCLDAAYGWEYDCNDRCVAFNYDAGTCAYDLEGCGIFVSAFCQCWINPPDGGDGPPWPVPRSELPQTI